MGFFQARVLEWGAIAFSNDDTNQGKIISEARADIGEGNGTLLQYACLENPMDGGAW